MLYTYSMCLHLSLAFTLFLFWENDDGVIVYNTLMSVF